MSAILQFWKQNLNIPAAARKNTQMLYKHLIFFDNVRYEIKIRVATFIYIDFIYYSWTCGLKGISVSFVCQTSGYMF